MIVREQQADDYEAIRHVYAEAFRRPLFRRPQNPGSVPPEVSLFEALWEAGDAIPAFSFTALTDGGQGVGRDISGAGMGGCLPGSTSDRVHRVCRGTVSIRVCILVLGTQRTFPHTRPGNGDLSGGESAVVS